MVVANGLGIDPSRGYRRAAFVSASLVAVFRGGMEMQTNRENTDCPGPMSEADKLAIKAIPASMFEPKSNDTESKQEDRQKFRSEREWREWIRWTIWDRWN
jgi:hypothetical protein